MKLLYDFLFIAGMIISCTYVYVFYKSKERGLSKSILIVFFGLLVFALLESYATINNIRFLHHISFIPAHSAKLLLGPLLLMYIQSLFFDDKKVLKKNLIYFIPFVLFVIFVSFPYLITKISDEYLIQYGIFLRKNHILTRAILDVVFLFFLYRSFNSFYKFKRVLKCNYSHIEHNNFIWVRYVLIAPILVIFLDFIFASYQIAFGPLNWRTQNVVMVGLVISILYAAYYGINQSKVLIPYFLLDDETKAIPDKKVYNKLEQTAFTELEQSLISYMEKEKPYLDEELTLNKLAIGIGTTDKKLSALLNHHIKTSFYTFINSYRINEFKKLIGSPLYADYTIEGIAYDCGFKSKASFYRLFKKETGQSPSEFKASLK